MKLCRYDNLSKGVLNTEGIFSCQSSQLCCRLKPPMPNTRVGSLFQVENMSTSKIAATPANYGLLIFNCQASDTGANTKVNIVDADGYGKPHHIRVSRAIRSKSADAQWIRFSWIRLFMRATNLALSPQHTSTNTPINRPFSSSAGLRCATKKLANAKEFRYAQGFLVPGMFLSVHYKYHKV